MARQYTVEEAAIILMVADAIEKERLNVNAPTFSCRILAMASKTHPWELEMQLDRWGVFADRNYRRDTSALVTAVEAALPVAEAVLDAHAEELRADGMPAPQPRATRKPKDTIGDVTIGGIVFAGGGSDADCGN